MPIFVKLTIFLQSFLFFAIQPAVAKLMLPKVGGSSQAWIISLLFFQILLLIGYSLNLVLNKKSKSYILITFGLIGLYFSFNVYEIEIQSNYDVLKYLILNFGLFSILLSYGNPLLQKIASSYSLYSFSNAGSLLALISYPFLVEKYLTLTTQLFIFKIAFIIFLAMLLICILKSKETNNLKQAKFINYNKNLLNVFLFSVCLNALLIIVTNNLCLHFAEAPFLWILPLSVFLIAFIIGFLEKDYLPNNLLNKYADYSFIILPAFLIFTIKINFLGYLLVVLLTYFFISYKIIREIFKLKPEISKLVPFYIYLGGGGVVGTILVGIIAPILFVNFHEIVFIFGIMFFLLNKKRNLNYFIIIALGCLSSFVNIPIVKTSSISIFYFSSVFLILLFLKKDTQKLILFTILISISFSLNKNSNEKKTTFIKKKLLWS